MLGTFNLRDLQSLTKMFADHKNVLVVANKSLLFLCLVQLSFEVKGFHHCVEICCWVSMQNEFFLLQNRNSGVCISDRGADCF